MADNRQITLTILGDAKGALAAMERVEKRAGGMSGALKRAGEIAAGFLAATVISKGASSLVGFLGDATQHAADLEQSIGGVESVFGDSAGKILEWGKTADKAAGLSKNAFNELAVPLGAMLKNSGMEDFSDQTLILAQRAADMAATFGGPVDQALSAITAGLRGEADPLERYGVKLSAAAVEARALADSGKTSAAALTDQEKAAARVALVLDQTTVAAGKFAAEAETASGKVAIQRAAQENLAAALGTKLLPIQIAVTEAKMKLVDAVTTHVLPAVERLSEWMGERLPVAMAHVREWIDENRPQIEAFFERVKAVGLELWESFQSGVAIVMPLLTRLGEWIVTKKPILVAALLAIGAAVVLAMGPASLAVAAILGIITAIGWLHDHWRETLDFIKGKVQAVMDWLGSPTGLLVLTALLGPAGLVLGAVFRFRDEFSGAFEKIWDVVDRIAGWIVDRINEVKSALASMPTLSDVPGAGLVEGAWNAATGWIPGRANGGPVRAGVAYRVGERGPETFVPNVPGQIIPAGGGGVVININTPMAIGSAPEFRDAVLRALDEFKRRGGRL